MSEIKVNSVVNSTGDNDSGLDLSTNDQVIIKTANTTAVTVDSSQNTSVSGDLTIPDKIIHDGDTNTAIRFPSADTVTIETGGSERVRLDTAQFLVGKTSQSIGTVGIEIDQFGRLTSTRDGDSSLRLNRLTSDGSIIQLRKDGSTIGTIGSTNTISIVNSFISGTLTGISFANVAIFPTDQNGNKADNSRDLGFSNARFDDLYLTNTQIQTSDRNEKQDIEELTDAEKRVAVVAKGLMRKFRWKDKVAEKGDKARTHFGIIAQDLEDAFKAEGLDASKYAMFTSSTWWEKEISVDAVEADEAKGIEAQDAYTYMDTKEEATEGYTEKTRLGVRYSELLAFIISAI